MQLKIHLTIYTAGFASKMQTKGALNMAGGKGKGMKLTKSVAKEKKGVVRAKKGMEKKGKDFSSEDEVD